MLELIAQFMQAGGEVLYLIAALTFVMWMLIMERSWYYLVDLKKDRASALQQWEARAERTSWAAHKIRLLLVSQVKLAIHQHLPLIQAMVALCPMFGLLGTVWGMIEVFNVMAVTGGGDVKAMASGVSKATIPTMAGMVAALSGLFASTFLKRMAEREITLLEDQLTMDH
ncbi:MAG TPA: MotA/TolQ/ExbB proton channel family protein [Pseudomonadales bacterium]